MIDVDASMLGLLHASWQGGLMAVVIVVASRLLGPRLSPRLRGWLWWLVALRLALPVTVQVAVLPTPEETMAVTLPTPIATIPADVQVDVREADPLPVFGVERFDAAVSQASARPSTDPSNKLPLSAIVMGVWFIGAMAIAFPGVLRVLRFRRRVR
ncbi:MAG: hypothetical protein AAF561_16830, partial [Planctomycetota bacterium]